MKQWIGKWIIIVGVIHVVFGAVVFIEPLSGIVRDGVWNAVDGHSVRPLAFWFESFGLLAILFGAAVDQLEKGEQGLSAFLVCGFAIFTLLIIIAMPVSGAWLMIPAVVGLLIKRAKYAEQAGS